MGYFKINGSGFNPSVLLGGGWVGGSEWCCVDQLNLINFELLLKMAVQHFERSIHAPPCVRSLSPPPPPPPPRPSSSSPTPCPTQIFPGNNTGMPTFRYFWPDPFSADPFPIFFPQLFCLSKVYVNILYFLLFHLSLSELSVSFCVHFLWDGTHT